MRPSRGTQVWGRLAAVGVVLPVAFASLRLPAQTLETHFDMAVLGVLGLHGIVHVSGHSVLLVPAHHSPFVVVITSSCSALAPVLAVGCLGAMIPPRAQRRRWKLLAATLVAASAVVAGNLIRIDASVLVGLAEGVASLVLFHNTVGALFSFIYVLGGFLLMLWILLPPPPGAGALRGRSIAGHAQLRRDQAGAALGVAEVAAGC